MARFVSLRQAAKAAGMTYHQVQRNALIGHIRTVILPGSPIRYSLDDATAMRGRHETDQQRGGAV